MLATDSDSELFLILYMNIVIINILLIFIIIIINCNIIIIIIINCKLLIINDSPFKDSLHTGVRERRRPAGYARLFKATTCVCSAHGKENVYIIIIYIFNHLMS